ncbi:group II truncated hemoglobin [Shewanella sp. SNU WT4]|uniref:group II truncated hemoglobin n=1 Tax=Shewanella sp. SNU WT4 TaxID=2590015 RepID=UPI001126561C|nr:group II truncated hemoglobin [Shewanella sp. SNU WT4]QDF65512.1 group II truncated hemoglobin [Shewanella sp. SNU WT4]
MKWLTKLFKPVPVAPTARQAQQSNAYDLIGGADTIANIASAFYQEMQTNPDTQALLAMHRAPIAESQQKLFEFLSGWLGGPALFEQKHGHPALRARHMPFAVTTELKDQWLLCMDKALSTQVKETAHQVAIYQAISELAANMVNQ